MKQSTEQKPKSDQKPRADKAIKPAKKQYPLAKEKDTQFKDQPEFIEPRSNKKG